MSAHPHRRDRLIPAIPVSLAVTDEISAIVYTIAPTFGAGLAIPLGAMAAAVESIKPDWLEKELRHTVFAFGGGIGFMFLDILLYKIDTPATQFMAMLSDYLPESIALGSTLAMGDQSALLLAGLIALQNLPESFNGFRKLLESTAYKRRRLLVIFWLTSLLGPLAGISGYLWLSERPQTVAAIMLLASGGILYSFFQDIAPLAKLEKHWAPYWASA